MPDAPERRAGLCGIVLAGVVACAVFAPTLGFGFVYDDHWTVEGNPALGSALAPLLRTLLAGRGVLQHIPDATRPAMVASLWLDRHLFGDDPAGYHLHSLLLYAVVTLTAGLAVFAVTRRRSAALAGSLVFAVMPAHAEVVAAVNYREDLHGALGVFVAIFWLLRSRRRPDSIDNAVICAVFVLVTLLAKESAAMALPVAVAIAATRWPSLAGLRAWAASRRTSLLALGAVLVLFLLWRGWLRIAGRDDIPLALVHRGLGERILRTARFSARSTVEALVPLGWSPDYAPESAASALWLGPFAAIVVAIGLLVRRRRTRVFAAGIACALVAPLATSPLVSPINDRADRFLFVATLGGAIVWGELLSRVGAKLPPRARGPLLGALVFGLALLTRQAIAPWHDDALLWQVATRRAPDSSRAWTGYSGTLRDAGDLDAADRAIAHAIQVDPHFLRARVTSLHIRLARGDLVRARQEIEQLRVLGGETQAGMRQARRCVLLTPEEAVRCIGFSAKDGKYPVSQEPAKAAD